MVWARRSVSLLCTVLLLFPPGVTPWLAAQDETAPPPIPAPAFSAGDPADNPDSESDAPDTFGRFGDPAELTVVGVDYNAGRYDTKAPKGMTIKGIIEIKSRKRIRGVPVCVYLIDAAEYDAHRGDPSYRPQKQWLTDTGYIDLNDPYQSGQWRDTWKYEFPIRIQPHIPTARYYILFMVDPNRIIPEIAHKPIGQDEPNLRGTLPFEVIDNPRLGMRVELDKTASLMVLNLEAYQDWKERVNPPNQIFAKVAKDMPTVLVHCDGVSDADRSDFRRHTFAYLIGPDKRYIRLAIGNFGDHNKLTTDLVDHATGRKVPYQIAYNESQTGGANYQLQPVDSTPDTRRFLAGRNVTLPNTFLYEREARDFLFRYVSPDYPRQSFRLMVQTTSELDPQGERPENYKDYTGVGTHPDIPDLAFANLTVILDAPVKRSVTVGDTLGNKWAGFRYEGINSTISKYINIEKPDSGININSAQKGNLSVTLLGMEFNFAGLEADNDHNQRPNERDSEPHSNGAVKSEYFVTFSWDPKTQQAVMGGGKKWTIEKTNDISQRFWFGPVPVKVGLEITFSLELDVRLTVALPNQEPIVLGTELSFGVASALNFRLYAAVDLIVFQAGAYGQISLFSLSIRPAVLVECDITNRQVRITLSLKGKLSALEGEAGLFIVFPNIKLCWGWVPCGVESTRMDFVLFRWSGICIIGEQSARKCEEIDWIEPKVWGWTKW